MGALIDVFLDGSAVVSLYELDTRGVSEKQHESRLGEHLYNRFVVFRERFLVHLQSDAHVLILIEDGIDRENAQRVMPHRQQLPRNVLHAVELPPVFGKFTDELLLAFLVIDNVVHMEVEGIKVIIDGQAFVK